MVLAGWNSGLKLGFMPLVLLGLYGLPAPRGQRKNSHGNGKVKAVRFRRA
jgi:hypothetical protein